MLQTPIVVPVFWGFKAVNGTPTSSLDPDGEVPYALAFLDSLSTAPVFATLAQYYNGGQGAPIQPRTMVVTAPIFDDTSPAPPATFH